MVHIFFNNSTGKQFLLAQAFTNFHNLLRFTFFFPQIVEICESLGQQKLFSRVIIKKKIVMYLQFWKVSRKLPIGP